VGVLKIYLLAIAVLMTASAAQAAPQIQQAWSRPTAAGTTGAGFMTLTNPGAAADALISAASPLARGVEIHRSSVAGGVASMQRVARVPIPPGGSVIFAPGGHHLMFLGLTRALKPGDRLPATLVFASGAKLQATFVVGVAPPAPSHDHH
jgi:copper(I)-binding protein